MDCQLRWIGNRKPGAGEKVQDAALLLFCARREKGATGRLLHGLASAADPLAKTRQRPVVDGGPAGARHILLSFPGGRPVVRRSGMSVGRAKSVWLSECRPPGQLTPLPAGELGAEITDQGGGKLCGPNPRLPLWAARRHPAGLGADIPSRLRANRPPPCAGKNHRATGTIKPRGEQANLRRILDHSLVSRDGWPVRLHPVPARQVAPAECRFGVGSPRQGHRR